LKKIVTILGARPQFVKGAVLSRIILEKDEIEEVIIHTGQHYDVNMSDVFFDEMQIPKPKYNLNINGLSHGAMTGQMLEKIEEVLLKEKPAGVVVFGDTNSTLSGALAAKKLHIKLIHIEAGLRSFNMKMPEEVNRILTDRIADLLSCPTDNAVCNLRKEGLDKSEAMIVNHGDIMKDAVEYYTNQAEGKSEIIEKLEINNKQFVLATIHRQENTDSKSNLRSIFEALDEINKSSNVILPLHPRTANKLKEFNIKTNITLIDPVGYFDMLMLLKNCKIVITDSGGLQKEAYFNKKHVVIVREETEWIELVNNDYASIVGSNKEKIVNCFTEFLSKNSSFEDNLYGNNVGEKYTNQLKN